MKIGFISKDYPTDNVITGIGNMVKNVSERLAPNNNITVFTASEVDGNKMGINFINFPRAFYNFSPLYALNSSMHLSRLMKNNDFDIVECESWKSEGFGLAGNNDRKFKYVHRQHTPIDKIIVQDSVKDKIDAHVFRKMEEESIKKSDGVIFVSEAVKNYVTNKFPQTIDKCFVVYNGIDLRKFSPKDKYESRKKLKLPSNKFVLLFVGHLGRRKGFDIFLDLIKNLDEKKFHFLIVGRKSLYDNDITSFFEKLLKFHSNITHYNCASENLLMDIYSSADVVIVPSRYESFSLVCLEAEAMGRCVVASNVGGIPEVCNKKSSILCSPDYSSFLKNIFYLFENGSVAKKIGNKGRKTAKKFSWNKTAKETLKIYKNL